MYDTPYTLLNFNCPDYLKEDIDAICKFRRISRTALINTYFEAVVKEWKPRLQKMSGEDERGRIACPRRMPVSNHEPLPTTDCGETLAIFANLPRDPDDAR